MDGFVRRLLDQKYRAEPGGPVGEEEGARGEGDCFFLTGKKNGGLPAQREEEGTTNGGRARRV